MIGFFNMPHATWSKRFYFFSEGRHAEEFFGGKIRRLWPGVNPRYWVPEASMLTIRTPKMLFPEDGYSCYKTG
jgi:hypothetical protein